MAKTQLVTLVSNGIPYLDSPLGGALIDGHSVQVRPYTAKDQKDVGQKGKDAYLYYRQILSNLVEEPKLKTFDDLLIGDIVPVLVAIKSFTYGPKYKKSTPCIVCEKMFTAEFLITDFPVEDHISLAEKHGEFQTSGLEVEYESHMHETTYKIRFHLPRLKDEQKTSEHVRTLIHKKEVESDNLWDRSWVRLCTLIDSIEDINAKPEDPNKKTTKESGIWTIGRKLDWLGGLDTDGPNDIVKLINNYDLGLVDPISQECPNCGADTEVRLEIDHTFFRAT